MTLLEISEDVLDEGLIQAFIGYIIVFVVLIFLVLVFLGIQRIMTYQARKALKSSGDLIQDLSDDDLNISGDVNAAISAALYMYFNESHIEESGVITIKKIQRRYSPWSSKIYNINNQLK